MTHTIKNHPRTILAGALSAALMFCAGGVMAQDATQDSDTTAQQGTNQGQAHGQMQDQGHDRTSHDQTQRQDGSAQGTAQHTERDRDWYQTMDEQVEDSEGGATHQRGEARDHADRDRTMTSRDQDRDRMTDRDGDRDVDGGILDRDSDQPINDTWITTKVKASLLADSDVAGMDVDVETINGVVHLSGYVDDQQQIDNAVRIARDIEGVTSVESSGLQLKTGDTD